MRRLRTMTMPVLFTTVLTFGLVTSAPAPATAQQQVGLVNLVVGDVTILENVNVGLALGVAANICDVNVNVLAVQLRSGGATCTAEATGENVSIQMR